MMGTAQPHVARQGCMPLGGLMLLLGAIGWLPVWFLGAIAGNEPERTPDNSDREMADAIASVATSLWLAWMILAAVVVLAGLASWARRARSRRLIGSK